MTPDIKMTTWYNVTSQHRAAITYLGSRTAELFRLLYNERRKSYVQFHFTRKHARKANLSCGKYKHTSDNRHTKYTKKRPTDYLIESVGPILTRIIS